jgi:hypothetical protein
LKLLSRPSLLLLLVFPSPPDETPEALLVVCNNRLPNALAPNHLLPLLLAVWLVSAVLPSVSPASALLLVLALSPLCGLLLLLLMLVLLLTSLLLLRLKSLLRIGRT